MECWRFSFGGADSYGGADSSVADETRLCFYKKPILWNVESGDNSVYNMSKPCRLTRCNVEAYERTKANTCHLLYPVINQWSEETPFLSILRLKLCYSFSLKVNPRPLTLPTAPSLELAKSCQQVIFSLQLVSPIDDFSQEVRTVSYPLAFLNWPYIASRLFSPYN